MKYLIGNQVINADHIVRIEYRSAENNAPESEMSSCFILTDEPCIDESWSLVLRGKQADRFWEAYIGDAYHVYA